MDAQSFDRIARLLGGAASRRTGIKAAVLAAVGLAARGVAPGEPAAAKPGKDGPCGDHSGKDNRCAADGDCCTQYCANRRCRCIRRGKPCRPEQKCCRGTCTNGKCPKPKRCVRAGKSCKTRTHTTKKGKKKKIRRTCCSGKCTNGVCPKKCKATGESCGASSECCSGLCDGGICKVTIPTSEACVAGDICADPQAECTIYEAPTPAGTYCLLAQGERTCAKDNDCVTQVCDGGTCAAYQPGLAAVCGATSADLTCKASSNAACQTYANNWQNSDGDQYFCTLDVGDSCPADIGDCGCKSSACNSGTCCDTDTYTVNNKTCSANNECCSNLCQTMGTNDPRQLCIGQDQVWGVVNYSGAGDNINVWAITSQDVPYTYGTDYDSGNLALGSNKPFQTSGGAVYWYNQPWLPIDTSSYPAGPGNQSYPNGDGDAYCRDASGSPYTALIAYQGPFATAQEESVVFSNTRPGYKYRVLANWDAQCFGDNLSVDACGPSWSGIDGTSKGIWQTNAVFKFSKGSTQVASITVPSNPGGTNPLHKYWWWVADVTYDDANQPTVHVVNTLHECMPIPYALDGGPVSGGLRQQDYVLGEAGGGGFSNWCTPTPFVTST